LRLFLITLLLTASVLAQNATVGSAAELAHRLGGNQELDSNVRLRFQILGSQMEDFNSKKAPDDLLRFFSDTRVMVWNRPVSPLLEQTMRQLEGQMVALAQSKGQRLDLPPVGYAPQSQSGARLLSSERVTPNGLQNVTLQTERLATEVLGRNSSAELLFLRDNLTRLREDLQDGNVASDSIRSVLGARARFLASGAGANTDQRLTQQLTILAEVLRGMFSVETLRASRGQVLTF